MGRSMYRLYMPGAYASDKARGTETEKGKERWRHVWARSVQVIGR